MKKHFTLLLSTLILIGTVTPLPGQHSVARKWNEMLLRSIRRDFARPTVHARNLFHVSAAMYDAWSAYECSAQPWLLGNTVGGYTCPFTGFIPPPDVEAAREEAISYAAYRMLRQRFAASPGAPITLPIMDSLLMALGYDKNFTSTDYSTGSPAALGNYIAACYISFGLQDGSNQGGVPPYGNLYYAPVNPPLLPDGPGNPSIIDPNRWQSMILNVFIDQSGNPIPVGGQIPALTPEWGNVTPFSLEGSQLDIYERDGDQYKVYLDPGPPPYIDTSTPNALSDVYKWGFLLDIIWSSHLKHNDTVMIDISPASLGNVDYASLPVNFEDYDDFYNLLGGGVNDPGHPLNPVTGLPYAPNIVPRGDYARVLAEFWADGPQSETPPGHWFSIINHAVNDHPLLVKRIGGTGPIVDDLEWDIKLYFSLGGAMHDAAIACWGAKGWYDYIRPVSAIRMMADYGQCTDPMLPSYHPAGLPLVPGYVGIIDSNDALGLRADFFIGDLYAHVGKIKIYAWRGDLVDFIDPTTQAVGVGWMRAENWWPYQLPTFVTPPFPGYYSGHSTYSRTAAELMTRFTGSEFFPGGMGEFFIEENEYLDFEEGPSQDIILQWATYQDASDQTSLSRIWGGIHPPQDDIPGRHTGVIIGPQVFEKAESLFHACVEPLAGTYYIDPSQPRTEYTFPSLSDAFRCLRGCGMDNTVILKFPPGLPPQVDRIYVDAIPGNSEEHPVVVLGNNNTIQIDEGSVFTIEPGVVLHIKNLRLVPE